MEPLEQIAQGGMGTVLRARDGLLDRDLAVKRLHDDLCSDPEMVRRFLDEARLAGQLQHPGIAPVHDLGLDEQGRPYFAMRLVKGQTLHEALARRASPSEELPYFLGVLESVCQTVAYAHAKGVVHRDLKPENVMLGPYGEVLVMDWGMAKVLGRQVPEPATRPLTPGSTHVRTLRSGTPEHDSLPGSVLGTPGYLAPEQARGDTSLLDQRTDVFSLGGILCEVLTGTPPHTGTTAERIRCAARGDVSDARRRLAACAADPALVGLAEECLSAAPEARPPDAGVVAGRLREHRLAIEARVRSALAAEAEARGSAAAEARRRRTARRLSAAIVVLVLAGSALWVSREQAERRRVDRLQGSVGGLVAEARGLEERAQATGTEADWERALPAARAAEVAAAQEGVPADLGARAAGLLARVEAGLHLARETAAAARRDLDLERELEQAGWGVLELLGGGGAHGEPGHGPPTHPPAPVRDPSGGTLRTLLSRHGLGVGERTPAEAAARVRTSRARDGLLIALHVLEAGTEEGADADWLDRVLDELDDDPWRRRLRSASSAEAIKALLAERGATPWDRASLLPVVLRLVAMGEASAADAPLRAFQALHPGDLLANALLAVVLLFDDGRQAEASPYATATLALRPDIPWTWALWGLASYLRGEVEPLHRAAEACRRLGGEGSWPAYVVCLSSVLRRELPLAVEWLARSLDSSSTIDDGVGEVVRLACVEGQLEGLLAAADALTPGPEAPPRLHLARGCLLRAALQWEEALPSLRLAEAGYREAGDVGRAEGALGQRLVALWELGDYPAAARELQLAPPSERVERKWMEYGVALLRLDLQRVRVILDDPRLRSRLGPSGDTVLPGTLDAWEQQKRRAEALTRDPGLIASVEPDALEDLAAVAWLLERPLLSARLYALAAERCASTAQGCEAPDWADAAQAAAAAGAGKSPEVEGLDEAARAGWRSRALEWARRALDHARLHADRATPADFKQAFRILRTLEGSPPLRALRSQAPTSEWALQLWQPLDALKARIDRGLDPRPAVRQPPEAAGGLACGG